MQTLDQDTIRYFRNFTPHTLYRIIGNYFEYYPNAEPLVIMEMLHCKLEIMFHHIHLN